MHVKRSIPRGIVMNTNDKKILIADPERIPIFNSEQDTKALEYTTLMKSKEIWKKYTGPFHKSGDEPASNIDVVYRALWLPPDIPFEKYTGGELKQRNILYEAMPFSTSSSLEAAQNYLKRGAFRGPGYSPYIFIFYLQPNKDAYIDARASYIAHTLNFNEAGFKADINDTENQLNKQKEITLYPGQFLVNHIETKDDIHYVYVKRLGTSWIIEHGGLAGGSRRTRRNRTIRKTRRVRRSSRT